MSQNQQLKATYQALAWYGHTFKYLGGIDPNLATVFTQAMQAAGYPGVSAAEAIEAICADFLAGQRWATASHPTYKVLTDEKIAEQERTIEIEEDGV